MQFISPHYHSFQLAAGMVPDLNKSYPDGILTPLTFRRICEGITMLPQLLRHVVGQLRGMPVASAFCICKSVLFCHFNKYKKLHFLGTANEFGM